MNGCFLNWIIYFWLQWRFWHKNRFAAQQFFRQNRVGCWPINPTLRVGLIGFDAFGAELRKSYNHVRPLRGRGFATIMGLFDPFGAGASQP